MLVLSLASVLALVGALSTSLAAVAVARQRAAAVADLAALAARSLDGQTVACDRAVRIALANGGRVLACRLEGEQVSVTAQVRPPGVLGGLGSASARARAGPTAR